MLSDDASNICFGPGVTVARHHCARGNLHTGQFCKWHFYLQAARVLRCKCLHRKESPVPNEKCSLQNGLAGLVLGIWSHTWLGGLSSLLLLWWAVWDGCLFALSLEGLTSSSVCEDHEAGEGCRLVSFQDLCSFRFAFYPCWHPHRALHLGQSSCFQLPPQHLRRHSGPGFSWETLAGGIL